MWLDPIPGVWQTWTPTYTNITVGNGTVTARYTQIGNLVTVYFEFALGSTSTIGTSPQVSAPVTPHSNYADNEHNVGSSYLLDAGTNRYMGVLRMFSSTFLLEVLKSDVTYLQPKSVTATVPFTWTTGDKVHFTATYEAA